jgi:hypothetical protein
MAIQLASDFLSSSAGGSGGGDSSGFAALPQVQLIEPTGSLRAIPIPGSTDIIRTPAGQGSSSGSLGYRRVTADGSSGGNDWLIDWNAIGTFTGSNIGTSPNSGNYFGKCQISTSTDTIYIAMYHDNTNTIFANYTSYLITASLSTGTISAVTEVDKTNITVALITTNTANQMGYIDSGTWWEVTSGGGMKLIFPVSNSAKTKKGYAFVELASDLVTVVSQDIYFDSDNDIGWQPDDIEVAYVAEDFSFVYFNDSGNYSTLLIPGHGVINFDQGSTSMYTFGQQQFLSPLYNMANVSAGQAGGMLVDEYVCIKRYLSTFTSSQLGWPSNFLRSDLDAYFKQVALQFGGVVI